MSQANKPSRAPTRDDLLAECAEVQERAMTMTRTYQNKGGDTHEFECPDLRVYLQAIELKAKLLGLLGDGKQLTETQLRSELDRMGWKLVPKGKLKEAG